MRIINIATLSVLLVVTMGCLMDRVKSEEITIEGTYCKDVGHPFPGPALLGPGGYYRLSGEKAQKIYSLKDQTKIQVSGKVHSSTRAIPEAGTIREITEKVIEVKSFNATE